MDNAEKGYNPHNNRGRKQSNKEAPSKKAALNREAQRNLRQRKQNYINDLESRVAELTAALMQTQQANMSLQMRNITSDAAVAALEIERLRRRNLDLELECQVLKGATFSSIPVTACISCFAERAKTAICMDQICALETVVNGLKIQLENTATESLNSSQSPETTYTANASEMDESVWEDVKSAEQLYGPMEVDSFKITVKSLPSFKYRQDFVDEYFDLIEQEAKVATPREARQLLVKIVKANSKVRKVCSVMDRMKCLELTAIFHERNLKQEIHFSKLCEPSERSKQKVANRPLTNMPPQVERFNLTVKSIPSFKDSFDLVDQLCSFWVYECDSDDFFHMNYLLFQLEIISKDVEDRTKMWVAMEILSQWSKKDLDDLVDKVEATVIGE